MTITLVRHTSVNVPPGVCYGQSNVDISATFEAEAEVVYAKLKNKHFDAVYSSSLIRCRKLATYCGYSNPKTDDRLMEMNFGDWELQDWNEIQDPQLQRWFDNWAEEVPTNGESFKDMIVRVESFLNELKNMSHKHIVIFTHAGVMRAIQVIRGELSVLKSFETKLNYGDMLEFVLK